MGKRRRESSMEPSKEEKHIALKEKYKELEHHQFWDYSNNLRSLHLISRSPRKLMFSLQTTHKKSLSEEEESLSSNACSVCSDCLKNEESDEEVRSVVVSSASIHGNTCCNENNANETDKFYEEEKEIEINKGPGEIIASTNTNVKNAEKIRNVGWELSVLITVLVLIGLVIAAMLSVNHTTWYADQDLDQVLLPPT